MLAPSAMGFPKFCLNSLRIADGLVARRAKSGSSKCWTSFHFKVPDFHAYFVLVQVSYDAGPADTYDVPLIRLPGGMPSTGVDAFSVLRIRTESLAEETVLVDALSDTQFLNFLLDAICGARLFAEPQANCELFLRACWRRSGSLHKALLLPSLMKAEQSNSSIVYGQRLILKIFRRVESRNQSGPGNRPIPYRTHAIPKHCNGHRSSRVREQAGDANLARYPSSLCRESRGRLGVHPQGCDPILRTGTAVGCSGSERNSTRVDSRIGCPAGSGSGSRANRILPGVGSAAGPAHRRASYRFIIGS